MQIGWKYFIQHARSHICIFVCVCVCGLKRHGHKKLYEIWFSGYRAFMWKTAIRQSLVWLMRQKLKKMRNVMSDFFPSKNVLHHKIQYVALTRWRLVSFSSTFFLYLHSQMFYSFWEYAKPKVYNQISLPDINTPLILHVLCARIYFILTFLTFIVSSTVSKVWYLFEF